MGNLILRAIWRPLALLLAAMALIWRGRADASRRAAHEAAGANIKTRERMDDADIHGDDPAAARRWMRERDANQR